MGNKGTCKACILLALCYLGPGQSKGTNVERVIHIHELHLEINQLIISVPFLNIFFVSCQTFTVRETTCFLMFHLNATHFLPSFLWSIKVMVNYHCVKSLTRLYTPGASFSSLPWSSKACGTEEPLINWLIMLMIFFTVYELILCASNNITICD